MNVRVMFGFVALTLASAYSGGVQVNVKPGLWEHTVTLDEKSVAAMKKEHQQDIQQGIAEVKKRLAEMPPEQRIQVESMIKMQGGDLNSENVEALAQTLIPEGPMVTKECLTQAQIDKGVLSSTEGNCKNQITQVSSNVFKVVSECKEQAATHRDDALITVQNPKSYTGKASFTSDKIGGASMQAAITGKWLSSDCGDVKPESDRNDDEESELLEKE